MQLPLGYTVQRTVTGAGGGALFRRRVDAIEQRNLERSDKRIGPAATRFTGARSRLPHACISEADTAAMPAAYWTSTGLTSIPQRQASVFDGADSQTASTSNCRSGTSISGKVTKSNRLLLLANFKVDVNCASSGNRCATLFRMLTDPY